MFLEWMLSFFEMVGLIDWEFVEFWLVGEYFFFYLWLVKCVMCYIINGWGGEIGFDFLYVVKFGE